MVREYDRLFKVEAPGTSEEVDFLDEVNENSLHINDKAMMEPALKDYQVGETVQFMRIGYFSIDQDSTSDKMVFNRTVTLRDGWKNKK